MYQHNAYNTYAQNNVGVESPQKLIEMLFEGILRFNTQAKRAIKDKDIEKRTYWINRSSAIFTELINCLSHDGSDMSLYLEGLYSYQLSLLSKANSEDKIEYLDEVNGVVRGLIEAWREETNVAE